MNIKHLETAIRVMEEVRDKKLPFDITMFRYVPADKYPVQLADKRLDMQTLIDCGTVCCFSGWMAVHPDVIAQGSGINEAGAMTFGGEDLSIESMAAYLEVTREVAEDLILPGGYMVEEDGMTFLPKIGPEHVLAKLYDLLDRTGAKRGEN